MHTQSGNAAGDFSLFFLRLAAWFTHNQTTKTKTVRAKERKSRVWHRVVDVRAPLDKVCFSFSLRSGSHNDSDVIAVDPRLREGAGQSRRAVDICKAQPQRPSKGEAQQTRRGQVRQAQATGGDRAEEAAYGKQTIEGVNACLRLHLTCVQRLVQVEVLTGVLSKRGHDGLVLRQPLDLMRVGREQEGERDGAGERG